jgi:hypothetical protein
MGVRKWCVVFAEGTLSQLKDLRNSNGTVAISCDVNNVWKRCARRSTIGSYSLEAVEAVVFESITKIRYFLFRLIFVIFLQMALIVAVLLFDRISVASDECVG